jgi:hypothetical protein
MVITTNLWEVVEESSALKKEQERANKLAMLSRTHAVTHLAGPPTSQVAPSYVAPIQQRKNDPHPSVGGARSRNFTSKRLRGEGGGGEGEEEDKERLEDL